MKIFIDNGHGISTPGKRSPDGRLREYKYAREIASSVVNMLRKEGYNADLLVPEDADISLTERAFRANQYCKVYGNKSAILVSIHCNAAGDGSKWMTATGWSAYTSKGYTQADTLAECLYDAAEDLLKGQRIRKDMSDGDRDWEESFTILTKTNCPAVLTENFFQDNKKDVEYLLSREGRRTIVDLHVKGIKNYLNEKA